MLRLPSHSVPCTLAAFHVSGDQLNRYIAQAPDVRYYTRALLQSSKQLMLGPAYRSVVDLRFLGVSKRLTKTLGHSAVLQTRAEKCSRATTTTALSLETLFASGSARINSCFRPADEKFFWGVLGCWATKRFGYPNLSANAPCFCNLELSPFIHYGNIRTSNKRSGSAERNRSNRRQGADSAAET